MSRFNEDDVLEIRGNRYRVKQIDSHVSMDGPLQYRLEPLGDAPPANLKPGSARKEEKYAIREYYNVEAEEVEVIEE